MVSGTSFLDKNWLAVAWHTIFDAYRKPHDKSFRNSAHDEEGTRLKHVFSCNNSVPDAFVCWRNHVCVDQQLVTFILSNNLIFCQHNHGLHYCV